MNKQEFLSLLAQELSGLPGKDVTDRLAFYDEMIDDRIEEGLSEEDAVDEMGPVDEVAAQILEEIPLSRLEPEEHPRSEGHLPNVDMPVNIVQVHPDEWK